MVTSQELYTLIIFNLRVFYARKRIRSDLGLNPEDIGKDTPKGQSEDNNNN